MSEQPKLWSVTELSEAAGVNVSYVRKLCAEGKLTGVYQVGKMWVIPRDAGDQWLAERRRKWEKFNN